MLFMGLVLGKSLYWDVHQLVPMLLVVVITWPVYHTSELFLHLKNV